LVGSRAAFRSVTCGDGTPLDLITYGQKFIYRMASSHCVQMIVYMLIKTSTIK
jgi:hypothetical protein